MKAVIQVTNCQDCPYAHDYRGQGEGWKECRHPQHNRGGYGNILWGCQEKFKATPSWCPLEMKKPLTLTEIQALDCERDMCMEDIRKIEQAHGIGEKDE